jgi:hypothetical protein
MKRGFAVEVNLRMNSRSTLPLALSGQQAANLGPQPLASQLIE